MITSDKRLSLHQQLDENDSLIILTATIIPLFLSTAFHTVPKFPLPSLSSSTNRSAGSEAVEADAGALADQVRCGGGAREKVGLVVGGG
jgi:hypothetical protein